MSAITKNKKTAIVLFNLGGPDNIQAVKPFLFNLFNDKYIINLPFFLRYFVAKLISSRREKAAKEIYLYLGGKSPILEETKKQAECLCKALQDKIESEYEVFICMRHWHPMSDEVIKQVKKYSPDEVILLPLYPQFSTTTTASSIEDFTKKLDNDIICKTICCYPTENNFINAHTELLNDAIKQVKNKNKFKVLFSAHGLPKKIIDSGDPYQFQIESTVANIVKLIPDIDYKITYQSKVGPLEWIGPSTENEINIASKQGIELIIVPIAFVSEHSETLVELDIEYKEIADRFRINYIRVPALTINESFIKSLRDIVIRASQKKESFLLSGDMSKICSNNYKKCPCRV